MSGVALIIVIAVAAAAGALIVYIYFAARPTAYDEPVDVLTAGVRIQQVAGLGAARARILLALGALLACLAFLSGYLRG